MLEERECPECHKKYEPPTKFCNRDGQPLAVTKTLIGRVLHDKYRLEDWLGGGGMATVYRATHLRMGEEVAVKVLDPTLVGKERIVDRFRNEARAAMRLNHPNAIRVTDFDTTEDKLYYLVMEIVKGRLLSEMISEERFDCRRAVKLLCQACEAIDAAHKQDIIHRDLKPNNIMVKDVEGKEVVKVLDFGIARLREPDHTDPKMLVQTKPGTVMGTPQYMSPEQCRGEELGPGADVYSLGVIAYEMLCQRPPFSPADNWMEFVTQLQTKPPPPLNLFAPDVPVSIERVILRTLEKNPANRPHTANALAQDLRKALREAGTDTTDPFSQSTVLEDGESQSGSLDQGTYERFRQETGGRKTIESVPPDGQQGLKRKIWIAVATIAALAVIGLIYSLIPSSGQPDTISDEFGVMKLIRGGKFTMGRNDGDQDERPAREIEVKDFYLDQYEVTNEQYKKFVVATGHRGRWINGTFPPGEGQLPVTYVTWADAAAYAKWARKRLPIEAEWEYAARGGSRGYLYPWGNEWRDGYANAGIGASKPVSVRGFENDKSPFEIYGMAGNVSEWVDSFLIPYAAGQSSRCPECRVYRGGNFKSKVEESTATYRVYDYPEAPASVSDRAEYEKVVFPRVGFRCAK
ncbi:MAG: protein kinase domain-containing protein [Candidatus Methylomirabilis sp.]